jgi:GTPase
MKLFRLSSSVASLKRYSETPKTDPKPVEDFHLPRPHPIRMNETSAEVISYKIPNRPLTPLYEIPIEARLRIFPYFKSPPNSKSISVALIGAPNAGKTSILNSILGEKYFSVSRKVNTTKKTQEGIKTIDDTQIVFYDTPGVISTHSGLTNSISTKGWDTISTSDISLFIVDAAKTLQNDVKAACTRLQNLLASRGAKSLPEARIVGETQEQYEQRLANAPAIIPACLIINKVDLVTDRRRVKYLVSELSEYAKFQKHFFVSAEKNYNIDALVNYISSQAMTCEWRYHPSQVTTLSDIEMAEDIVREQLLNWIHDELPYRWVVRTLGWTPYLDGTLRIDIDILVMTNIHIGILIGKEGRVIKQIFNASHAALSKLYQRKIELHLTPKLMKTEAKKASIKGLEIEIKHPRLPTQEQFPMDTLQKISDS